MNVGRDLKSVNGLRNFPGSKRLRFAMRDALQHGATKTGAIERARATLSKLASADYFDIVDADTFEPLDRLRPPAFAIGAARFGTTRLIDNVWIPA